MYEEIKESYNNGQQEQAFEWFQELTPYHKEAVIDDAKGEDDLDLLCFLFKKLI